MDFRNRSKARFENEMTKLLKDLYVSCLDRAEKILRPDKHGDAWKQFRFGILNLGNDKIRQLADKLEDYTIEFRPAIFSVEYKVDVPTSQLVEFDFEAHEDDVWFKAIAMSREVVDALETGLGCGFTQTYSGREEFIVEGLYDIFHKVIPFFDKNECFKGRTLERYNTWKEKVYSLEKANA